VNAHDRALELAVARVDFSLTESEREVLHRHLDACAQCRGDAEGVAQDARRLTSRPVHRLAPERSAAMRLSLERPRRGMSPAMVFAAAALLLVAGIATAAVGAEIVRRMEEPRLAVLPVPSVAIVSPAPSAGPAESPVVPSAWTMTDAGTLTPGLPFVPAAVASSDLGWIAIGGGSCVKTAVRDEISMYACASAVARSADGRTWTASGTLPYATNYVGPSSGPEAGIVDVAAGPEGFVAVGYTRDGGAKPVMTIPDGAGWWSLDGVTWERILLGAGARPSVVFRAPDRWLIGGVIYRDSGPIGAIWTSSDGRNWTLLEDAAPFDVGGYVDTGEDPASGGIRAFAWNGSTIVAGGQVCADTGRPCVAAAWTSADGATWERVSQLPAGYWISDIVSVNGIFVAVAERCVDSGCKAVVIRSDDGRTWTEVSMDLPETARISSTGTTIVLVTGDYRTLDVRASADGAAWTSLGSVSAPERVNWGAPILVARPDGVIDLLIRFDPLDPQESEADVYTATWTIAPTR
jgi:hypothetical protein